LGTGEPIEPVFIERFTPDLRERIAAVRSGTGLLVTAAPPRRMQLKQLTTHAASPYRAASA
jgi:hypothetical protein